MGFLWVGTEDGLHRFNGYEFVPYVHNPNDTNSLKDDHIRGLLYTKDTLWLATSVKGIVAFIPSQNRFFTPVEHGGSIDFKTSLKVLHFNNNILVFSVQNHFILYNITTGENTIFDLPLHGKLSQVSDVLHLSENKCWISTTASGILEMDPRTMEIKQTPFLKDKVVNTLTQTADHVYIGTETGMFIYNKNEEIITASGFTYPVNCFYQKNEKEVYVGTDNGLFLFDLMLNDITPIIFIVNENRVYKSVDINQVIGDERGNLWIGTEGDGLLYYNAYQKKFETLIVKLPEYSLTNDISTFQILKESEDSVLLGTKYGVARYDRQSNHFQLFPSTKDILIYTLKRDNRGAIWAGGFTSGLLKYNPANDSFQQIFPKGTSFTDNDVIEIVPVNDTVLWVCTWSGGIYSFNTDTEIAEKLELNGEAINRARTSFKDSKGNIWLGTDDGVLKISPQMKVERFNSETPVKISSDRVFSIIEDNQGRIWLATNVGLTRLDLESNNSKLLYKQKGLPNDFIYSILIDDSDKIWVSTNHGISVFNQQSETFKNYTVSDGLQHNEFNGKAGYKDDLGNFYFGGISGLNIFKPEEVVENPYLPAVYIESLELFNKQLGQNELYKNELRFKSKENVLTFHFSALNYVNPEKCDYQYQMVGFDTDWRPVSKLRSSTYTNLDPGEYTFKVRASNDAGIWNTKPAEMKITIVPPWYNTNGFRVIFVLVFLMSGILFYLFQTRKLKRDKLKLEIIIQQRTKQIQDKNEKLQIAFLEAEKQRDNIAFLMKELRHRVKNNLQIISSLLNIQSNRVNNKSANEALKMAKNRIMAISQIENKISSENENIDIGNFIREVAEGITHGLAGEELLKYKLKLNLCSVNLKKVNTTLIGLILNELITNVTKYAFDEYSESNFLLIGCVVNQQKFILTIIDNGKGYNPDEIRNNAIGLELVNDMVSQLRGKLEIENINGTKNTIVIPI